MTINDVSKMGLIINKLRSIVTVIVILFVFAACQEDLNLCNEAIKNKDYDKAIIECTHEFTGSMSARDSANTYDNRGIAYAKKGLYDQAINDFNRAINLNPSYEIAYYNRGIVYSSKGYFDKAITDYIKAIELNPYDEYSYLNWLIATWLSRTSDADAVNKLRSIISSNSSREWVRTISRYYVGNDGFSEQSVLAEAKNTRNEKEIEERLSEAYFYIGIKRLIKGDRRGAVEYLTKSIEMDVKESDEYGESKAMLELMEKGMI